MFICRNLTLCKSANRLHLELLTFGHATVDSDWGGTVTLPTYSRLYYMIDGTSTIQSPDGEMLMMEKGNWYLVPSGYSSRYGTECAMEQFFFHIKLRDFHSTDLLRNCGKPLCLKPEQAPDCEFMKHCLNSNKLTDGLRLRQIVSEVLTSLLDANNVVVRTEDYSTCVYSALMYIKHNLSMQLTITEIAENIFVSKSTLTKHFQKELGMSVNEYICDSIMANAEKLLLTSNISVQDLSQKFGYSDQLYFSKRFKDKFGVSPRNYRKINGL